MMTDINNVTLEDLKCQGLENLSEQEQLVMIAKYLPELELHEVASYMPSSSHQDEAKLKNALIENPESFIVSITRDYKIVTEVTRYQIARELKLNNVVLNLNVIVTFTDDEVKTILDKEFLGKFINCQQRAVLVYQIGFKYEQEKAKLRMTNHNHSEEENGKALHKLADKYQVSRSYLQQARASDIADGENGTHYLEYVRRGLASFDHIKKLRNYSDQSCIKHMEGWLDNGPVTYESANIKWNNDLETPVKLPRVGAYYVVGYNNWKSRDRKEEDKKRKKVQESIAHVKEALGLDTEVNMPTSHEDAEVVPLRITNKPKYGVTMTMNFQNASNADMIKSMQDIAIIIDQYNFAHSSYSIRFIGLHSTKYANVYIPNEEESRGLPGNVHKTLLELNGDIF